MIESAHNNLKQMTTYKSFTISIALLFLAALSFAQTNIALNRPVTTSSYEGWATVGTNAVDGNSSTRWSSAFSDPQWIYVDLGTSVNVDRVKIVWEAAAASNYKIQTSPDATTWTDIKTITGNTTLTNDHTQLTGAGRYVRIYGTSRLTTYGYSIYELEVYTTGSGGIAPTANAGADQTIALPTNSLSLYGSGSDADGTISSYAWSQISGSSATLTNANTATLNLTGLTVGEYVFRLTVTDNSNDTGVDNVTVTVNPDPNNPSNLALNKPAFTSSTEGWALTGAQAVDANISTRWSSAVSDPQWIYVDLGANASINRVKIVWETARASNYQIQTSTDASTWTDIKTVTANATLTNDHTQLTGTGRYLRIYGTTRATPYGYSIYELEVYGELVPASPGNLMAAAVSSTSMSLNWVDNSTNETGFQIERSLTSGIGFTLIATTGSNATSYTDASLSGGTQYFYRTRAINAAGGSDYTAEVNATTPTLLNQVMSNYSFQYRYDGRKRMVAKKIPGAEWMYLVYDNLDRLVLTQDGNQRTANQWTYSKYDQLNRPVMTGIYTHDSSISQEDISLQVSNSTFFETYNGVAATHGYTNTVWPTTNLQLLTATYYDDYSFITPLVNNDNSSITTYNYQVGDITGQYEYETTDAQKHSPKVRGLATGTKINTLGTSNYLYTVNYFDEKNRPVQVITQNLKSGYVRVTNKYDFAGKVEESKRTYLVNGVTTTLRETFTYDHAGRLVTKDHSVNGAPSVLISKNEYNEIGQVVDKKLHSTDNGTSFLQSIDYRYNIRGWLTSTNNSRLGFDANNNDDLNDLFGMELGYNSDLGLGATPQYNGNVAAIKWSNNTIESNVVQRGYAFAYDPMNRLTAARQKQAIFFDAWTAGNYDERGLTYDLNGNILKLSRVGDNGSLIDSLTYNYGPAPGNKLWSVQDAASATEGFVDGNLTTDDYTYDPNGNLTLDKNKQITGITYNSLNLPRQVNKGPSDYIVYTYDATGKKLAQQVLGATAKTTDYMDGLVYENDVLKFVKHSEGRVLPDGANWEYQYNLTDHLGNVRTTFTVKQLTDAQTATLEPGNQAQELAHFLRLAEARKIQSHLFDRTNGTSPTTTPGYAQRLNGSANEKYGLAKSISVMPGDVISAEVYAKYVDTNSSNWTAALNTLLTQIAAGTAPAGTVVDGTGYSSSTTSFPFAGLNGTAGSSGVGPKAYLNWLVFNRNGGLLNGGYQRLSDTPKEYGQDVAHELIAMPAITITQPGLVYIYLSNEEATPVEVYFDDFKVTHVVKTPVIQSDDYYPFGLTFNSYQRVGNLVNQYQYNSQERQDELDLGWLDYGARMYMPELGRWGAVDPLSEASLDWSTYNYALNNPVRFIDPDGMDPEDVVKAASKYIGTNYEFGGKNPTGRLVGAKDRLNQSGGAIKFHTSYSRAIGNSYGTDSYSATVADVYNVFGVKPGSSFGIDCSGLVAKAFNADQDKLMGNLLSGSANDQLKSFADAEVEGTGVLHSDFNSLGKGDVIFKTNGKGEATHTMIATGEVKTDKNGNVSKFQTIEAPSSGDKVRVSWKNIGDSYQIGHTFRKTDLQIAGPTRDESDKIKLTGFVENNQNATDE
jgi:RHS repeat-associated protein